MKLSKLEKQMVGAMLILVVAVAILARGAAREFERGAPAYAACREAGRSVDVCLIHP